MELSIFNVIERAVVTPKSSQAMQKENQMTLQVHPDANKVMIKEALEKLFDVKVKSVRTLNRKGKIRRSKRKLVQSKLTKHAFVTLKEGYSLNLAAQESMGVPAKEVKGEE
jgi:large subunit ribosomal protein L23